MTALKRRLIGLIRTIGPINVAEYMAHCLLDPQHGYYTTREPFGRAGDFITAPEISQMFGEIVGVWMVAAWRQQGRPEAPVFAEIGPGRGTLAKDMARTMDRLEPGLRDRAEFALIEASNRLRDIQAATLENAGGAFNWRNSISDLPEGRPLFIVGNELFDAIPVRQYFKASDGWRERLVGVVEEGTLGFVPGQGTLDGSLLPPGHENMPEGSVFEIAPARSALMQQIAERIARDGGAALFFDYGNLTPGFGDTLQAVRSHQYDPPLSHPGEADITTHVDFDALAMVISAEGLRPQTTTQGQFLLELGLLARAGQLGAKADAAGQDRLRGEVQRLAAPDAMGELFKVLAFSLSPAQLPGFSAVTTRA